MNIRTQGILLNAGFKIFRINIMNNVITYCKSIGGWGIYGKYETKAACIRALDKLLLDEKNLIDE